MKFIPRTTCPERTNKYYVNGSYNPFAYNYDMFKLNGNCTTYAYGRAAELLDRKPVGLPTSNAENWFADVKNFKKISASDSNFEVRVGDILVYRSGNIHDGSDGAGHVCIVEEKYLDGSILISESGYKHFLFRTRKLSKPYKWGENYILEGVIRISDFEDNPTEKKTYTGTYPTLPSRGFFCYDTVHKKVLDRGEQVKNLQRLLNWILDTNLVIDGALGPLCDKAILQFQKTYGLSQDGCFGKACLSKAKTIEK